jgi:ABC-type branched-subunit amino acid transport system substrate-binding protein
MSTPTISLTTMPQNQDDFDKRLYSLPHQRKEVLKLYLQLQKYLINSEDLDRKKDSKNLRSQKELDCKIAKVLGVKSGTVRTHLFNARQDFGLTENEPYPREKLVDLFYKYKRDWIEPYDLVQPSSNFYLTAGINYFDQKKYPEASELFQKAIDGDCTDPIAQIYFNNAKARQKNNPFKIGVVVAYFRNDFHVNAANNVLRGIADAQTKFNKNNGKDGRLLEIVLANDHNHLLVAMEVSEYLALDKDILAIIGNHSSESTRAVLSIYEKELISLVSPTSTSSKLRSKIFFRTIGSTKEIASKYVSYIKDYLHLARAAIFYHKNNEYSQTLMEDFTKSFQDQGGKVTNLLDMSDPFLDLDEEIRRIKMDCKVEIALVLPSIETNCVAIAIANKNAKQSQKLQLLFATSLPETPILEKGGASVEGVVLVSPSLAKDSAYMKYTKDRWQQPTVNWRVVTAYNATQAIIEAIELSTVVTREAILENLKKFDLLVDRTLGFGLRPSQTNCHTNTKIKYSIWQIYHGQFKEI